MTTVRIYFREDGTTQADLASYFEKNNPGEENEEKNNTEEENEEKRDNPNKEPIDRNLDSNESRESQETAACPPRSICPIEHESMENKENKDKFPRDLEIDKLEEEKNNSEEKKEEKVERNSEENKENPIPCAEKPRTYDDKPCKDAEEKKPDVRNLEMSVEVSWKIFQYFLEIFKCSQASSARELDEYHSIDDDAYWKNISMFSRYESYDTN